LITRTHNLFILKIFEEETKETFLCNCFCRNILKSCENSRKIPTVEVKIISAISQSKLERFQDCDSNLIGVQLKCSSTIAQTIKRQTHVQVGKKLIVFLKVCSPWSWHKCKSLSRLDVNETLRLLRINASGVCY
jgi:hypothetical protein